MSEPSWRTEMQKLLDQHKEEAENRKRLEWCIAETLHRLDCPGIKLIERGGITRLRYLDRADIILRDLLKLTELTDGALHNSF